MDINNAKTVGAPTRKPRTKLTAINNFLMCFVCKGYIIEATAVSECLHSFCRSCIVKHLLKEKHCPKCKLTPISIASLRPDDIIKSLVYKVVPGLFQSECQRRDTYNLQNGQPFVDDSLPGDKAGRKQYYFAPDEPISLSLTYDTESLVGSGITSAPPINYLQCPAAVTVHHLKRFVSAKYGINAERDVNIEIICEDEVLPGEFTLMDVAYCFNWTRVLPMDLLFRILLNPNANRDAANKPKEVPVALENDNNHNRVGKKPAVGQIQTADKNNGGFQVSKENYNYRTRDVPKTVRFDLPGPEPVVALTQMTSKLGSPAKKEPEGDFKRLRSSNSASSPPSSNGASVSSEKKTKPIAPPATKKAETLQLQVKYEEEKKCYSNPKKEKKEVPKLKIDLPNMKAQLVEEPKQPKLVLKLPSPLRTEPQQLPLEEYAKKIGLQPVQRKHEESHRKRKNKKHSKEPNKKRKLHAEVSSLTLNDEVKLKVKITTKEKSRSSAVSEEKLSVKDVEVPSVSPKPAPVVAPAEEVKATSLLRAVRKPMVFIPNAPKIATDPESDVIAEIVSRMKQPQAPPPKAPTPTPTPVTEKPRASPPMPPPKPPMSRPTLSANPLASLRPPSMAKLPQKPTNGPKPPAIPHVPVLMPQFSQASMLDIRMQRMNSAPRGLAPRPPPQRLPMMAPRPPKRAMTDTQPPMGSKTPRLDLMEISAQNRLMKKQVYVPSLMEMGKKMEEKSKVVLPKKPSPVPQKPTSAPPKTTPVPQKASPVPQTAPQKIAPGPQKPSGDAAKKLPRLIAPSSISVTKVGESSSTPAPQSHRPAVEILKISSSAPTIDKPAQAPQPKPKANRPPPPNIPLDKIRKSFPGGLFKLDQALDLSSPKGVRADLATLELQRADPVQSVRNALDSLRQNETQNGNGETAKKSSVRKMDTPVIDLTDSSSDSRPVSSAATEKKMPPLTRPPMPKLKPVRQQNLSVRNVPNPSALVFRNQAQGVPSKPVSAPMKSPPPVSKLSEKIHQLHQMQNQRKITPED